MKQELENKRPDSEERRSIWQRWKQNLKDWVWFCKEHPDWLDLDVQTWVSTHIGQPLRRRWQRLRELRHQNRQRQLPETEWKLGQLLLFLWGSLPRMGPISGSGSPAAARGPSAQADGCGPSSRA